MYKKAKKTLRSFLTSNIYNDELFSRSSMNIIIRALLEPVASQNAISLVFTRFKNKEGLEGLIKRLEYCNNVEMVDVTVPNVLIKDDYVELEFVIFTSARYNFVLIWDYSNDPDKNKTSAFFLANSRLVNDVYEVLQTNLTENYKEKFYLHKPERRENELLNEALFNVLKKLNNSIEENAYSQNDDYIVDLSEEENYDEKIRTVSHEIKNQLSIIDVYLKLLEKETKGNKNIEIIKKASDIISLQLNDLKNYENDEIKELILQDVIEESSKMMEMIVKSNNNKLVFHKDIKYDIKIFADENKLISVLNNIVKNANESTKNDIIELNISIEKNKVHTDITNHGPAVSEQNKKRLFDKGFTTKTYGHGIGLYSCKKYIENFKGTLELLNSDKEKTTFRITLPLN